MNPCPKTNFNGIPLLHVPYDYKVKFCRIYPCPKYSLGNPCPNRHHQGEKLIPYGKDHLFLLNDIVIAQFRRTNVNLFDEYLLSLGYDIPVEDITKVVKSPNSQMQATAQEVQSVVPFKLAGTIVTIIAPIPKKPITKTLLDEKEDSVSVLNQSCKETDSKQLPPDFPLNKTTKEESNSLFAYDLFSPQVFYRISDCD